MESLQQEFKVQVENLTERKIKVLRSDNGGEYTSKDFNNFYIEAWIKREYTITYNPQQNGFCREEEWNYHRGNERDDT
jgi:transposase InsO family protein